MNTSSPAPFACVFLVLAALYWATATVLHEAISTKLVVPFKNMLGAVSTEYAFVGLTLCGIGGLLWLTRGRASRKLCVKSGSESATLATHAAHATRKVEPRAFQKGEEGKVLARWLALAAATALCSVFLMVTRIEMAHFPQYAILAILLRLGGLSPASAYLAGQCGSILDEGRQYLVHPRFTGYFDWNDLLINSVGLCIGLLIVHQGDVRRALRSDLSPVWNPVLSRAVARVSAALLALWAAAILAGLASGHVRAYVPLAAGQPPDPFPWVEGSRVLALFLREPPAFWQAGPFGQYHIMGVGEGMVLYPLCSLLLFLCCFYRKNTRTL